MLATNRFPDASAGSPCVFAASALAASCASTAHASRATGRDRLRLRQGRRPVHPRAEGAPGELRGAQGARPREASRLAGPPDARPPAGRHRQAGSGRRRARACQRAEPVEPGHRRRAAARPSRAAEQAAHASRRQDGARVADRSHARHAAGRLRPPARREAARLARLPRRELARRHHDAGPCHESQRRVRPRIPRGAGHDRAEGRQPRRRPGLDHREHAHVLQSHGAAHDHRRPGYAGQASRIRRRSRAHVLSEQRRSQGDDRPAPDRHRPPPHRRRPRRQRADHQGHAGPARGGRANHLRDRQGQA